MFQWRFDPFPLHHLWSGSPTAEAAAELKSGTLINLIINLFLNLGGYSDRPLKRSRNNPKMQVQILPVPPISTLLTLVGSLWDCGLTE